MINTLNGRIFNTLFIVLPKGIINYVKITHGIKKSGYSKGERRFGFGSKDNAHYFYNCTMGFIPSDDICQ